MSNIWQPANQQVYFEGEGGEGMIVSTVVRWSGEGGNERFG